MRVLVDHQIFLRQKYGGISNYHSIIHRMINEMQSEYESTIMALGSNNKYIKGQLSLLKPLNIRGKQILRSINEYASELFISKYDVFHPSYYDNYFLNARRIPPVVLTVHDVIPERFFTDERGVALINNKKNLIYKADRIIAISETTKKGIVDFYHIDADKIEVIPHGRPDYFDEFLKNAEAGGSEKGPSYILFVGLRGSYKNFTFFLQNVSGFLVKYDKVLKVVGPPPTPEEMELIGQLKIVSRVSFHVHTSMEELFHFYNQAFCFVFPSLDEGFGIPLLEAFAADCPIICSDIEIFHEVCGEGVLYFDPLSKDSLWEQLEKLLADSSLRGELIRRGRAGLNNFSWHNAARRTLDVYRMAAGTTA
jgi:glycosyltransferase involved in cell wall biosynthesis